MLKHPELAKMKVITFSPRVEDTMGGNFVTRVSETWSSLRGHGHGGMGCCQREGAEAGLG